MNGWNQWRNQCHSAFHLHYLSHLQNIHLHIVHPPSPIQNLNLHPSHNLLFHHYQEHRLGGSHHSAIQNLHLHPSHNLLFHHYQKLWLGGSHHPHRLISLHREKGKWRNSLPKPTEERKDPRSCPRNCWTS